MSNFEKIIKQHYGKLLLALLAFSFLSLFIFGPSEKQVYNLYKDSIIKTDTETVILSAVNNGFSETRNSNLMLLVEIIPHKRSNKKCDFIAAEFVVKNIDGKELQVKQNITLSSNQTTPIYMNGIEHGDIKVKIIASARNKCGNLTNLKSEFTLKHYQKKGISWIGYWMSA